MQGVQIDRSAHLARFLVLGSASPRLLHRASESLAGRIAFHEIAGFGLGEVGGATAERLCYLLLAAERRCWGSPFKSRC